MSDISLRLLAERLVERLGTQIVIENQPTGGGVAAAKAVLSSPPDGHTLALLSNATAVSAALFKKLPYDPLADFVPVGGISDFSYVFLTNAKSELRTLQDVIAAARANPGKLNFGTAAAGTSPNLTALLFRKIAGIDFTVVPFRGATDLTVALHAQRRGRGDQCLWRGQGEPARWQLARHRHHGADPRGGAARRADRRQIRDRQLRNILLERIVCARPHACRRCGPA